MLVGGEEREAGEAAGQRRERVERERGVLLKKKEETKERGMLPCFFKKYLRRTTGRSLPEESAPTKSNDKSFAIYTVARARTTAFTRERQPV